MTDKLCTIEVPTLMGIGERDSFVPSEIQYQLAMKIPTAQYVVIPNAGHAVIGEKPVEFNHMICDFLTGS